MTTVLTAIGATIAGTVIGAAVVIAVHAYRQEASRPTAPPRPGGTREGAGHLGVAALPRPSPGVNNPITTVIRPPLNTPTIDPGQVITAWYHDPGVPVEDPRVQVDEIAPISGPRRIRLRGSRRLVTEVEHRYDLQPITR